jgi:hypothetical protein
MDLQFEYDAEIDAWTMHPTGVLQTPADVTAMQALVAREFRKLHGKKAYILIDVSGLTIDPAVASVYGQLFRYVVARTLGLVRYGASGTTAATIRLEAIRNRFPSNIFPDRKAAIEALEHVRRLPATADGP